MRTHSIWEHILWDIYHPQDTFASLASPNLYMFTWEHILCENTFYENTFYIRRLSPSGHIYHPLNENPFYMRTHSISGHIYHPRVWRDGAARTLTRACRHTAAPIIYINVFPYRMCSYTRFAQWRCSDIDASLSSHWKKFWKRQRPAYYIKVRLCKYVFFENKKLLKLLYDKNSQK